MPKTTIIYYTANRIPERFARNVRKHLLESSRGRPIICVSQNPMEGFGDVTVRVPHLAPSCYNAYYQMLLGAERAETEFVACAEDDVLYVKEHFNFEPKENVFYYNSNVWRLWPDTFWIRRNGLMMGQCVAPTKLFVETLRKRFDKFKENDPRQGVMGEPGKYEDVAGLPHVDFGRFTTAIPTINIRHENGIMGRGKPRKDSLCNELPHWGNAKDLWTKIVLR